MRTSTLTLLVLALAAPPAEALAQSHVGQRVRVSGEWDGRALVAEKIRQRDPRKDRRRASIGGRISTLNIGERSLSIGPVTIGWTDATAFAGLRATDLRVGLGVEATVAIEGAGLRALRLEPKDADARELSLLAAVVAQECRKMQERAPVLQLLIYPAVDWTATGGSMEAYANAWPLSAEMMSWFRDHYLRTPDDAKDLRVSPGLSPDLKGLPPALIYTAGHDPLVDQGRDYAEALKQQNVPVLYRCFDSLSHGFTAMAGAVPAARTALLDIAADLQRTLG